MPRIDECLLNCVLYLYPNVEAAQQGRRVGGSGFLLGFTDKGSPYARHLYAVTNKHVINGGMCCIRLNTSDGKTTTVETTKTDWTHHPEYDVAVCKVALADQHAYAFVAADQCVTGEAAKHVGIGPGDEVLMVGRFIQHDGKQQNTPVVRHGRIAMMAIDPVELWDGSAPQHLMLLELHSISGFSGSPVFIYIPKDSSRPDGRALEDFMCLIGIDMAHPYYHVPIEEQGNAGTWNPSENKRVKMNTGMSWMIPVDFIMETLNVPELKDERDRADRARDESDESPSVV